MLNENNYQGVCVKVEAGKSSKGTPMIDIIFEITMEAVGNNWVGVGVELGQHGIPKRHLRIYLSDAARPMSAKKLASLGFNGDYNNPAITADAVQLVCYHEEYHGEMIEKWELANWGGGQELQALTTAEAAELKRWYQGEQNGTATQNEPTEAAPPDDDIPF